MQNPTIDIGAQATVTEGRYRGKLVKVLELKGDGASARCSFEHDGLNESEIKQQQQGHEFEPTWFGLHMLKPVVSGQPSETGQPSTSEQSQS